MFWKTRWFLLHIGKDFMRFLPANITLILFPYWSWPRRLGDEIPSALRIELSWAWLPWYFRMRSDCRAQLWTGHAMETVSWRWPYAFSVTSYAGDGRRLNFWL